MGTDIQLRKSVLAMNLACLKKTAEKGNMSRIIKKGDEVLVNLPLTVGILGVVIAPWGNDSLAAAGFLTAMSSL